MFIDTDINHLRAPLGALCLAVQHGAPPERVIQLIRWL